MLAKVAAGYGGVARKAPLPEAMQSQMDKMPLETPLKQAASRPCHGQAAQHRTNRISRGDERPESENSVLRWGDAIHRPA